MNDTYVGDGWTMWEALQKLPSYTRVRFAANGSKEVSGLIRDLPGQSSRRITVIDSGTEFFARQDTVFDSFEIVCEYGEKVGVPHSMFMREPDEIEENLEAEPFQGRNVETFASCPTCITIEQYVYPPPEEGLGEMLYTDDDIRKLLGHDDIDTEAAEKGRASMQEDEPTVIERAKDRVFIDKGGQA